MSELDETWELERFEYDGTKLHFYWRNTITGEESHRHMQPGDTISVDGQRITVRELFHLLRLAQAVEREE